jgi:hypothetical protein
LSQAPHIRLGSNLLSHAVSAIHLQKSVEKFPVLPDAVHHVVPAKETPRSG